MPSRPTAAASSRGSTRGRSASPRGASGRGARARRTPSPRAPGSCASASRASASRRARRSSSCTPTTPGSWRPRSTPSTAPSTSASRPAIPRRSCSGASRSSPGAAGPCRYHRRMPTEDQLLRAPKVLLHDHLDGGLRPETIIELARDIGYADLPSSDPGSLAEWFVADAPRRDLVRYLEGFRHTVGVMQTKDALERVAAECAEDLASDGVVYAEVRFAPELHTEAGLDLTTVVESVLSGFERGMATAAASGQH